MLRGYLLILAVIAIGATLLSRGPAWSSLAPPAAQPSPVHMVDAGSGGRTPADAPAVANLDGGVQLQREANGHFYADVQINGTAIHMLVDTGASGIALTREDARKAGIATSIGMNDVVGEGADGSVHGEFVMVDRIALGSTTAEKMPAMVLNSGAQSLLGQQFLEKFASVEIHGDTMTLH
jgi:aspartyl protease family protein